MSTTADPPVPSLGGLDTELVRPELAHLDELHVEELVALIAGDGARAVRAVLAAAPAIARAVTLTTERLAKGGRLVYVGAGTAGRIAVLDATELASSRWDAVRTDVTVSLAAPEEMATAARSRCAEGFEVLKLKVGTEPDADVRRIRAVASAVEGRAALRLDPNQAWSWREAQSVLGALERHGVELDLIEQPVPAGDIRGLAQVRRASPWRVVADEAVHRATDVLRVAELEAADAINVKLAKCGGLRAAADVVAVARAVELDVLVGCMLEPPSTVSAATAFAAAVAPDVVHDLDAGRFTGGHALAYRPPFVCPSAGG